MFFLYFWLSEAPRDGWSISCVKLLRFRQNKNKKKRRKEKSFLNLRWLKSSRVRVKYSSWRRLMFDTHIGPCWKWIPPFTCRGFCWHSRDWPVAVWRCRRAGRPGGQAPRSAASPRPGGACRSQTPRRAGSHRRALRGIQQQHREI